MYTPDQGKTIAQSDAFGPMEALEFLVALFIVITLPEETGNKESRNVSHNELSSQQNLRTQPIEVGSHFKVGGMWLGKNFLFK